MIHVHIGEASFERDDYTQGYPVRPVAIICPYCLCVWMVIAIEEGDGGCEIQPTSCDVCNRPTDLDPVPGSILGNPLFSDGVDWELLDLLPADLLRIEFEVTFRAYLKEADKCQPTLYHSPIRSQSLLGP